MMDDSSTIRPGGRAEYGGEPLVPVVARRFQAAREARGLTLETLACRTGVSRAQLSNYERGTANARQARRGALERVAKELGVYVEWLTGEIPYPGPGPWPRGPRGTADPRDPLESRELDPRETFRYLAACTALRRLLERGMHRDLKERCGSPGEVRAWWERPARHEAGPRFAAAPGRGGLRDQVGTVLYQLVDPGDYARGVLACTKLADPGTRLPVGRWIPAARARAEAWLVVLDPWARGYQPLNYAALWGGLPDGRDWVTWPFPTPEEFTDPRIVLWLAHTHTLAPGPSAWPARRRAIGEFFRTGYVPGARTGMGTGS